MYSKKLIVMSSEMFLKRHLGPDEGEIKKMLNKVGVESLSQLLKETIPEVDIESLSASVPDKE